MKVNLHSSLYFWASCILTGCTATAVTVTDKPSPPALVIIPPGSNNVIIDAQPVEQKNKSKIHWNPDR